MPRLMHATILISIRIYLEYSIHTLLTNQNIDLSYYQNIYAIANSKDTATKSIMQVKIPIYRGQKMYFLKM